MVNVIVASHGLLSKEIVESAKMILGKKNDDVYCLCLEEEYGIEKFENDARIIAQKLRGSNLIILADIHGGSPFNTCLSVFRDFNYVAVTGVNLAMLLEVLTSKDAAELPELADLAVKSGIAGISSVNIGLKT